MISDRTAGAALSDIPFDWRTKVIMVSGGVLVALCMVGITAVLPQIEAALAHDAQDRLLVKLLGTVVGFTMVIGAPLVGFLVDRLGLKPVLIMSCIIYALAGTAGLYLDSLYALLASRLVLGLTAAGIATISMTLINTRLDGVERAKWMGAHISVAIIGSLFLQPAIGYLGEMGWRWPFVLYVLSLPLVVIAAMSLGTSKPTRGTAGPTPTTEKLLSWFPVRFALLAFVIGTITLLPTVYVPFVLRDAGISSPKMISFVLLGITISGAVMSMLFGRSQRYISPYAALAISFACSALGMLIAAMASSLPTVVGGIIIYGFSNGWLFAAMMTAASSHVTAAQQGRATGLIKAAHYLAAPVSVLMIEPVTRTFGSHGALWALSAISFVACAVFAYRIFTNSSTFRAVPRPISIVPTAQERA